LVFNPDVVDDNEACGLAVEGDTLYTCKHIFSNESVVWGVLAIDLKNPGQYIVLATTNGQGGIALDPIRGYLYFNDFPFDVVRADIYRLALNQFDAQPELIFTTTSDYILSLAVDTLNNTLYYPIQDLFLYSVDLSASNLTPQLIASNLGFIDPTVQLQWVPPE
jgi:hypothetical protein